MIHGFYFYRWWGKTTDQKSAEIKSRWKSSGCWLAKPLVSWVTRSPSHRVGGGGGSESQGDSKAFNKTFSNLIEIHPKTKSLRLPPLRPTGSETLMVGPAISVLHTLRLTMAHICSRSPVKVSSLQNHLLGFTQVPLNSFLHTAVDLKPPGPKSI